MSGYVKLKQEYIKLALSASEPDRYGGYIIKSSGDAVQYFCKIHFRMRFYPYIRIQIGPRNEIGGCGLY
jgi:hypothetical protein